jgi:phosphoglycerate kinase
VAGRLKSLWKRGPVTMAPDCVGDEVEAMSRALQPGAILLLENLRFHPEEERNTPSFARELAKLADLYVNDAFGASHRAHASITGVPGLLHGGAAGMLLEKEIKYLKDGLDNPARPFVVILGGSKVKDKIPLMEKLAPKVDTFIIGGGMAYTFLRAQGNSIGDSLLDPEKLGWCAQFLEKMKAAGKPVHLPVDHLGAQQTDAMFCEPVRGADIPDGLTAFDIGPKTIADFQAVIRAAQTVLWNGPMGVFENPLFSNGTTAIAEAMAAVHGTTVVGGGDSVAAVNGAGLADKMTHISTGGGASLELLSEGTLPGIEALSDA